MTTPGHRRKPRSPERAKATRRISARDGRRTPAAEPPEEPAREPYGTVDGDALVKGWLAQMDDNGGVRPRSRHEHAETRRSVDHGITASGPKRHRSVSPPPSPRQRSQSIQKDDTEHLRFEKRPRHKTRDDRYKPRNDPPDHPHGRIVERKGQHRRRTEEPVRKRLASARDVIDNFASDSILNNRLTLQPASTPGLFQNGHASANKQPMDLSFNSMNFLSRPRERKQAKQPKDTGKKEREVQELSAFFRGDAEPLRRRRSGSTEPQRRKSTPMLGQTRGEHGRTATPARSPVTTYLSWSPSVVSAERRVSLRESLRGQDEVYHQRRLTHTTENTAQTRETHACKPTPRRETSQTPPPPRIVRYKDKGVMTLETRMGDNTMPVAAQSLTADTRDGLELREPQEKTKALVQLDQPCQVEVAGVSVAKDTDVDRPEGDAPAPADLGITASGRLLEPNPKNAFEDNEKPPPTRSSSPEYLASLEKVVSGRTTGQGTRAPRPVSKGTPSRMVSEQHTSVAAVNSDHQAALPESQGDSEKAALRSSESWIAEEAGLGHDYAAIEPRDHHLQPLHPRHQNSRYEYQSAKTDNLMSRVERELAKDAALSQFSHQVYREEADDLYHTAPVLEEDDWMVEPYMHEQDDIVGDQSFPGQEDYQWIDGHTHAAGGQSDRDHMSQFWRPNMFM